MMEATYIIGRTPLFVKGSSLFLKKIFFPDSSFYCICYQCVTACIWTLHKNACPPGEKIFIGSAGNIALCVQKIRRLDEGSHFHHEETLTFLPECPASRETAP